jgi:hypothetical protein
VDKNQSLLARRLAMRWSPGRWSLLILIGLSLTIVPCSAAVAQSAKPSTEDEAWPEADFHLQLPSNWARAFTRRP